MLAEGSYSRHNGEVSDFAVVPGPRNSIVFRDTDVRTLEDEQRGGFGLDDLDQRDTVGYKGTAVVHVGRHTIHGGVEFMRNTNFSRRKGRSSRRQVGVEVRDGCRSSAKRL